MVPVLVNFPFSHDLYRWLVKVVRPGNPALAIQALRQAHGDSLALQMFESIIPWYNSIGSPQRGLPAPACGPRDKISLEIPTNPFGEVRSIIRSKPVRDFVRSNLRTLPDASTFGVSL